MTQHPQDYGVGQFKIIGKFFGVVLKHNGYLKRMANIARLMTFVSKLYVSLRTNLKLLRLFPEHVHFGQGHIAHRFSSLFGFLFQILKPLDELFIGAFQCILWVDF